MPPARDAIWSNFYTIPSDIDLDQLGIHFKARKNASFNNAWCIGCVDSWLSKLEYGSWRPIGWVDEASLELWRKYRGKF